MLTLLIFAICKLFTPDNLYLRETAVKASAGCNWRSKRYYWNKVSKYNSGSNSSKNINSKDPLSRPKPAMAWAHDWELKPTIVDISSIYWWAPVAFGGKGPNWLFDLDYLTDSMNYQPVTTENKANKTAGPKEANHSTISQDNIDAGNSEMEAEPAQEYFVLPLWFSYTSTVKLFRCKERMEDDQRLMAVMFKDTNDVPN
ncbi:hypothetical protein Tco_1473943 [Tanacetum coccineum]